MNMNFKVKITKEKICYILFCICFLVYLVLANNIVYLFLRDSSDLKIGLPLEEYPTTATGHYGIETSENQGGMTEDFRIYGWAYLEADTDTSKSRNVTVILENEKGKTFCAPAVTSIRPDIYLQEIKSYKVPSSSIGFEAIFSTLILPDDLYRLYLYVEETQDVCALIDTGTTYSKFESEMHDHDMDPVQIDQPMQVQEALFAIDQVEYEGEYLLVKGWGFFTNFDENEEKLERYIAIRNGKNEERFYQLGEMERPDIAQAYGERYLNSGFRNFFYLPPDFDDEQLTISLITEKDGIFYRSNQSLTFNKAEGGYQQQKQEFPQENIIQILPEDISAPKDISAPIENVNEIYWSYDNISVQGSNLQVIGWAANTIPDVAGQGQAYLEITSSEGTAQYYSLTLTNRPDITAAFGEEQTENGFTVHIPLDQIPSDKVIIDVVYQLEDQEWRSQQKVEFDLTSGTAVWLETVENTAQDPTWPMQLEESVSNTNIRWAAEDISRQGSVLQIVGWATNLIPDIEGTGEPWMQLKWEDGSVQYYPLTMQKRDDIAKAFGSGAEMSGFLLQIPFDQLKNGRVSLSPVFLCEEGVFSSEEHIEIDLANEAVTIL